ncbi:MauE/DoxX family redox-associated membrane protein [Acetobacter oeni]|nr:MauE/DoxX family redox-associated membrane protein [Acetobacter oeni]MBB3884042.1 hypothetical protein [Acetobacter oeni]GBR08466.1 hypothetical protein AA21952_2626 [Acetobacter oeni LMG 21952]
MVLPTFSSLAMGCMGTLLLISGGSKLLSHNDLLGTIAAYRILPRSTSFAGYDVVAWTLTIAEMLLGAGLLLGLSFAAWASVGLFLIFALAIGINVLRGRTQFDCGCSVGGGVTRVSGAVLARALYLAVLAAVVGGVAVPGGGLPVVRAGGVVGWLLFVAVRHLRHSGFVGETV